MMEVPLFTREGHYVGHISMPPYAKLPEVVRYRGRIFLHLSRAGLSYVEVHCFDAEELINRPGTTVTRETARHVAA